MTLADGAALAGVLAALREVPGVSAAAVEQAADGRRLRLDLGPGVDGSSVAAQVDALLRHRFGVRLDVDDVQVVEGSDGQSAAGEPVTMPSPRPARGRRPVIHRLQTERTGLTVQVTVTLRHDDVDHVGRCSGAATRQGTLRAIATATAQAVQRVADDLIQLDVEHVEVLALAGSERTVVVALGLASSAGSMHLTGAAGVRSDVRQAVVRATLDAVNRRLEAMDDAATPS